MLAYWKRFSKHPAFCCAFVLWLDRTNLSIGGKSAGCQGFLTKKMGKGPTTLPHVAVLEGPAPLGRNPLATLAMGAFTYYKKDYGTGKRSSSREKSAQSAGKVPRIGCRAQQTSQNVWRRV